MTSHSPQTHTEPDLVRINASIGVAFNQAVYERHFGSAETGSSTTADQIIRITGMLMQNVLKVPGVKNDVEGKKDRGELAVEDTAEFTTLWLPPNVENGIRNGAFVHQKKSDPPINKNLHGVREPHHGTAKHEHVHGDKKLRDRHVTMADQIFIPKKQIDSRGKALKDELGRGKVIPQVPQKTVETGARKGRGTDGHEEYSNYATVRTASNQYAYTPKPLQRDSAVPITRKEAARQLWNARNEVHKVRATERARLEVTEQAKQAKRDRREAVANKILPNRIVSRALSNRRARRSP